MRAHRVPLIRCTTRSALTSDLLVVAGLPVVVVVVVVPGLAWLVAPHTVA